MITASRADETSFEDERWGGGHGVFSYQLLRGLGGLADANLDGVVTAGEILGFVQIAVNRETSGAQNLFSSGASCNRSLPLSQATNMEIRSASSTTHRYRSLGDHYPMKSTSSQPTVTIRVEAVVPPRTP